MLRPYFTSDKILVLKEVEAYPALSLRGGCRRSAGTLHWIQLSHGVGLDRVWFGKVLEHK